MRRSIGITLALLIGLIGTVRAAEKSDESKPWEEQRGYQLLIGRQFTPPDMDQELFENLWQSWEEPLRAEAEAATPEERRKMTLSRYGLTEAPGREGGAPLQYATDGTNGWSTNCFSCHGGKVAGEVIPGLPNTHIALETLALDSLKTKKILGREVSAFESAGLSFIPLGKSNGTTNAIIFGVVLASYRDLDLNVDVNKKLPKLVHNDHDAPPWWNVKLKNFLYSDGFAGKGHRSLMQFMMTPSNGPEEFHEAEDDFREIYEWVQNLEVPAYPFEIDEALAKKGEIAFNNNCADCHGTYGENQEWPEVIVPLEDIGTNRARLDSLTPVMRAGYEMGWFSNYGEKKSIHDPGGYVAQPLNGIWATAPYLHNGSVPTLWHMLNPEERPVVWKRTEDGYDTQRVGLEVAEFEDLPDSVNSGVVRRQYFNTRMFAKSADGHLYPNQLTEDQKVAVLEYLKTL